MRILKSVNHNEYSINKKISFKAGWNSQISKEIQSCDIKKITKQLDEMGIKADFKNNKVVAWCCKKVADVFCQLNRKYKFKLALPKQIQVEEFSKLKIDDPDLTGFCNWIPSRVFKKSDKVFPERTLFFNSFEQKFKKTPNSSKWLYKWENIDQIAEFQHRLGYWSSNHFLAPFIHEFGHAAQNAFLVEKLNPQDLIGKLEKLSDRAYIQKFKNKVCKVIPGISSRGKEDPFESIAEDMAKRISLALNSELCLTCNPFKGTFYPRRDFMKSFLGLFKKGSKYKKDTMENKALKDLWNGKEI